MKKKILLLAAALIVLKLPLFASPDGGKPKKMVASNNATMNIAIPYPSLAFENGIEGFVLVEISRTAEGNCTVLQINGSNPLLIEGVLQYLEENALPKNNIKEEVVVYQFYFHIY